MTPALRKELAASKRVNNRRGKGKGRGKNGKKSKLSRKRSMLRAVSAASWVEEEGPAKKLPKTNGSKPKAKAKAASKPNRKAAGKAKAKPSRRSKATKWEDEDWPEDDACNGDEEYENKQRHIQLGGKRWIYEILPHQSLGCAGCRFIFGGCFACQKESFRGQDARSMRKSEAYVEALAALDSGSEPKSKKPRRPKKGKAAAAEDGDE